MPEEEEDDGDDEGVVSGAQNEDGGWSVIKGPLVGVDRDARVKGVVPGLTTKGKQRGMGMGGVMKRGSTKVFGHSPPKQRPGGGGGGGGEGGGRGLATKRRSKGRGGVLGYEERDKFLEGLRIS